MGIKAFFLKGYECTTRTTLRNCFSHKYYFGTVYTLNQRYLPKKKSLIVRKNLRNFFERG